MAIYKDQFLLIDPANPPAVGTQLNFSRYKITDANNNGQIYTGQNDLINGIAIQSAWPGDKVTINVPGVGQVTYTGVTFYMTNGARYFTPNDGQVLKSGTFVKSTYVSTQGPLTVGQLGPACFTVGTWIAVPGGAKRVERLAVGDLVLTRDSGPQHLSHISRQVMDGSGIAAPVRFAPGTAGNDRTLLVSPQHRMLLTGPFVDLHFGTPEVLAPALHLVGLPGIERAPVRRVGYLHLLFDRHEIVQANGAWSESLHPGGEMALALGIGDLNRSTPPARPILTGAEARLYALTHKPVAQIRAACAAAPSPLSPLGAARTGRASGKARRNGI